MKNFGIYIHIPFCQKKCKYCDFISFDKCDDNLKEKYVESILKEIENCNISNKIVNTIYIGGGTPSVLSENMIEKIINKIKYKFNVANNAEITIEINPGTVDEKKLIRYKEIGINRLSIGLQSCDNDILEMLGRIHNYDKFEQTYKNARKLGFDNINVDLMLGLPKQDINILVNGLNKIIELKPEHISLYSLILEEGTVLEQEVNSGKLEMITDEIERKMYWETKKVLEKNGYIHYEISNFAKKGYESKHNLSCWNQEEYVGFGVAAHSYLNKRRFSNIVDLDEYINNCYNNNFEDNIIIEEEEQNFENQAKEYMMIGLRKIDGVSISDFEQKFKINPLFYFRFEISKLTDEDLIEVDLDTIKLTDKGLDFANFVFKEFC